MIRTLTCLSLYKSVSHEMLDPFIYWFVCAQERPVNIYASHTSYSSIIIYLSLPSESVRKDLLSCTGVCMECPTLSQLRTILYIIHIYVYVYTSALYMHWHTCICAMKHFLDILLFFNCPFSLEHSQFN